MRGALFLVLYLAMLPAALSSAHVGVMFYVWASLISANTFVYGFLQDIPYGKISIAVAILSILSEKIRKKPYVDLFYLFLIAFFCQCAISFAFSLTETAQFYAVADRIWKIGLLCLLMNPVLRGRLQVHSIVLVIGLAMGVQGALEGLKYLITGGGYKMAPPGNFGDNNSFGLFVLMTLPLLVYLFRYTIDPYIRLAIGGGILINALTIIGTGSRGAFVGILAVTLGMIVQSKRRMTTLAMVAIVGCAIAAFVPATVYQRVDTIDSATEDGSFMGRVRAWKLNTLVAMDRPFFGGGFSSMEDAKVWTAYLPKFSSLDVIPTGDPDIPRAAHSIYFQALGDTGFTGLFLYLGLLATTFLSLGKIRRMAANNEHLGWAYELAGSLRLSMIALVVAGAALSVTFYDLPFIVFTLVSVLRRTVRDELEVLALHPATPQPFRRTILERPGIPQQA
jgi:probable O-glycosylation ligase (exosortase A-associated)